MRCCTAHALYRSKLWQQDHRQHPQNSNPDGSMLEGTAQRIGRPLEVVERKPKAEDTARKTWTKVFIKKVMAIIDETPQRCGDPMVQSGGRWQTLSVAAGLGAGPQAQRDPGLASEGVLRLSTFLSLDPLLPTTWTRWTNTFWSYIENITNMTSHNTKTSLIAAIRRVIAELPPVFVEKASSNCGSVSRRWLTLKAATWNRCQFYCIIKLPELIFSIRIFK